MYFTKIFIYNYSSFELFNYNLFVTAKFLSRQRYPAQTQHKPLGCKHSLLRVENENIQRTPNLKDDFSLSFSSSLSYIYFSSFTFLSPSYLTSLLYLLRFLAIFILLSSDKNSTVPLHPSLSSGHPTRFSFYIFSGFLAIFICYH